MLFIEHFSTFLPLLILNDILHNINCYGEKHYVNIFQLKLYNKFLEAQMLPFTDHSFI